MEEICIRFSHLSEKIFDLLDNESIINCKEVSQFWFDYLDGQKLVEIRIIKATVEQFHSIGETWNKVFNFASTETILTLGASVNKLYNRDLDLIYHEGLTPIHTAAATGNVLLLKKLQEKSLDKLPKDNEGCTPLYYAAQNGHLEVCEYIIQKIEDNNPAANNGKTPLHAAASNGHFKVCELLIKNLENKNPESVDGITPLHYSALYGSVELYMLLSNHLINKNPSPTHGMTPLHMAAAGGQWKMCKFIMDSLDNKNPGDDFNFTPLHFAAMDGHMDVCKLILDNVQNKRPETQDGKTPASFAFENNHFELGLFLSLGQEWVGIRPSTHFLTDKEHSQYLNSLYLRPKIPMGGQIVSITPPPSKPEIILTSPKSYGIPKDFEPTTSDLVLLPPSFFTRTDPIGIKN